MRPHRGPLRLLAPLAVVLVIAGFTLVAAGAASAKPATPKVTELKIYRTPSGPQKGAVTVIATANYRGAANNDPTLRGTRSLAKLIMTLTGARHSITVSDTVRITHGNIVAGGRPVRFDIRVPRSTSRLLGNDKRIHVKARLGRTRSASPGKRLLRATGVQAQMGYANIQSWFPVYQPIPPPAPPVGFVQWQGGDPTYVPDVPGAAPVPGGTEALICVAFWGTGYQDPSWYSISLNAPYGTSIEYVISPGNMSSAPAADGSFSFPSSLSQMVGDYAQTTTGPQLSGTIPTSVLSSPVSSSTPPATLNLSPPTAGLPVSWTLGALTANQGAGVC